MHPPSLMQMLLILVVVLLLFGGGGRISSMMSDLAKGVGAFRKGLKEDEKKPVSKEDLLNVTPTKTDETKTPS
jgi:sec-independent protein translocase protein TatA